MSQLLTGDLYRTPRPQPTLRRAVRRTPAADLARAKRDQELSRLVAVAQLTGAMALYRRNLEFAAELPAVIARARQVCVDPRLKLDGLANLDGTAIGAGWIRVDRIEALLAPVLRDQRQWLAARALQLLASKVLDDAAYAGVFRLLALEGSARGRPTEHSVTRGDGVRAWSFSF